MAIRGAVAKSTMMGLVSVLAAITVVIVLMIGAVVALAVALGPAMPGSGASMTFFLGGAWIDLAIIVLVAFASGFFFTFRRLHSARRAGI